MDGNQLLKNYISHIERLKKEFGLVLPWNVFLQRLYEGAIGVE